MWLLTIYFTVHGLVLFPGLTDERHFFFTPLTFIPYFYLSWFSLFVAIIFPLSFLLKGHQSIIINITLLLGSFVSSLIIAEWIMFHFSPHTTQIERMEGDMIISSYKHDESTDHYTYPANQTMRLSSSEFDYSIQANANGLLDVAIDKVPNKEVTVLCLGDSFTEGFGVEPAYSWVKVFQRELEKKGLSVYAYNAGIVGSDPIFEIDLARSIIKEIEPDIVIIAINRTDVDNIITRGGTERFTDDGVKFAEEPVLMDLYLISFLVRHITHSLLDVNHDLVPIHEFPKKAEVAKKEIKNTITAFRDSLDAKNIDLFVATHPLRIELDSCKYDYDWRATFQNVKHIDILERLCANGLGGVNADEYFYPIDGHFNKVGYEQMGLQFATDSSLLNRIKQVSHSKLQ